MQKADCIYSPMPFYIDLSIHGFWYLWWGGGGGGPESNSPWTPRNNWV